MNRIYLIFIIVLFFVATTQAKEIPYAQKILLEAEFKRTEVELEAQVGKIKDLRTNIKKGKALFDEARHLVEAIYVFTLENLYASKKLSQFNQLAQLLNNNTTRNQFYYPVKVSKGFSGNEVHYVSWGDEKCVSPLDKKTIREGTIIELNLGRLNMMTPELIFQRKQNSVEQILAAYKVGEDLPIHSILYDLNNLSPDLTRFYNCHYVTSFTRLEKKHKDLLKRYYELTKILNKEPKNFSKEKKEKTISEEIVEFTSTLPKTNTSVPAPANLKPAK